jgi:hypothetical protein
VSDGFVSLARSLIRRTAEGDEYIAHGQDARATKTHEARTFFLIKIALELLKLTV